MAKRGRPLTGKRPTTSTERANKTRRKQAAKAAALDKIRVAMDGFDNDDLVSLDDFLSGVRRALAASEKVG
jgi:hypothetical protein